MMRTASKHGFWFLAAAAGLLALAGCLKRKETIRVDRNGGVAIRMEISGDVGDFDGGDPLPSRETGWRTEDRIETKDDGKQEKTRVALLRVGPREQIPESYAAPGDPVEELALRFPTSVEVERRPDGVYYHFFRLYEGRELARFKLYEELLKKGNEEHKPFEEMSDEQRMQLVKNLIGLNTLQMTEYIDLASDQLVDRWPQHYALLARQATLDYSETLPLEELVALLVEPDSPDRNRAIDEFGQEHQAGAREATQEALERAGARRREIELFFDVYDREEQRRKITDDLRDENWEVVVQMPGEIVAHNGASADGNSVKWEFDSNWIMDRDLRLMVTSRVTPGMPPEPPAELDAETDAAPDATPAPESDGR